MMNEPILLKPGGPCPICGKPIKTEDSETLFLLSKLAEYMKEEQNETD